ncbi:hypothetical protein NLI96_g3021 [Meripilus lineatus]|uniref:FAD-binding domain-containing protein n=1 Tax=Meripilus lineatus TaxID=2056292 RepID=A0AAD5YG14_9APHY|nr:hypothetical protein NLI96_g3021 [Physisporinus lineatus]
MSPSTPDSALQGKDFEVAIIGGGICGLACALTLAKQGVTVQIYEAASAFGEIGAGIGIGPNAIRILRDIGVLDDVVSKANDPSLNLRAFVFKSGMGNHEYPARAEDYGIGMHRASFLDALVLHVDPTITHFNKRCNKVVSSPSNPSRTMVHFDDGSHIETDVVLGADGIKSVVRTAVVSDQEVNIVAFVTDRSIEFGAANLPPSQPWVESVPQSEMLAEFDEWGSDVAGLLRCIKAPQKWMIYGVFPPLKSYVKGHVALLGDAAHAMLPHLGAGSGQGIEDAYLLGTLLGHSRTKASNLESVLKVYDEIRRPRAQKVWEDTRMAGDIYEGFGRQGFTPDGLRQDLSGLWDFVWNHDIVKDIQTAGEYLRELGTF